MFNINKNSVKGTNGIRISYCQKPKVLVKIFSKGNWREKSFYVDTGADGILMHTKDAQRCGLDINRLDAEIRAYGIGKELTIYELSDSCLMKIDNLTFTCKIRVSQNIEEGVALLGRCILKIFGMSISNNCIGLYRYY